MAGKISMRTVNTFCVPAFFLLEASISFEVERDDGIYGMKRKGREEEEGRHRHGCRDIEEIFPCASQHLDSGGEGSEGRERGR